MTTEEKAKAYDEAFKRAKAVWRFSSNSAEIMRMEEIFPELAESEDEKIRKGIISLIEFGLENKSAIAPGYNITKEEALAWLEKQGECKDTFPIPTRETILSIWELGNDWKDITHGSISTKYGTQLEYIQKHWQESEYYLEKQGKQKPTSDIKYKVSDGGSLIIVNDKPFDYEHATITQKDFALPSQSERKSLQQVLNDMKNDVDYFVRYAEAFVKEQEQKSAWSEEDKRMCQETIDWFEKKCFPYALEEENPARESIKWLKSLKDRVQPKQEWSEEDESYINIAISACRSLYGEYSETAHWLISLKNRMKGKED